MHTFFTVLLFLITFTVAIIWGRCLFFTGKYMSMAYHTWTLKRVYEGLVRKWAVRTIMLTIILVWDLIMLVHR